MRRQLFQQRPDRALRKASPSCKTSLFSQSGGHRKKEPQRAARFPAIQLRCIRSHQGSQTFRRGDKVLRALFRQMNALRGHPRQRSANHQPMRNGFGRWNSNRVPPGARLNDTIVHSRPHSESAIVRRTQCPIRSGVTMVSVSPLRFLSCAIVARSACQSPGTSVGNS